MCLGLLVIRFNVTTEIYATVIATSAVNIASGLCAAVSNLLVFVAILRTPHLHTSTNILLANLCVTDFLVGSIVQPFYVARKVTELFGQPICEVRLVYTYFGFLCTCASMLGLCLVSGERVIAVVRPLTYYSCVTKPRMYVCVGGMWLCWAVVCLTPFLVVPFDIFFQLVFCIIISSFLFMAAIYCRVFREAKRHQQRISAITASIESKVDLRRENKVARTMAIVVGAVMCCYLPQISLLLARALHGDSTRLVHVGGRVGRHHCVSEQRIQPIYLLLQKLGNSACSTSLLKEASKLVSNSSDTTKSNAIDNLNNVIFSFV